MFATPPGCGLRRSELARPDGETCSATRQPLVRRESPRQARALADDSNAGVGEERDRRMDGGGGRNGRASVPARQSGRSGKRGTDEQEGGLANAENIRDRKSVV